MPVPFVTFIVLVTFVFRCFGQTYRSSNCFQNGDTWKSALRISKTTWGAVIDKQFGTTDVLIYFPVSRIDERWLSKFDRIGV